MLTGEKGRRLFLLLTGVALFIAGALYLHLDQQHVDKAYLVTGGPETPTGDGTLAWRITGRLLDERADVRVDIQGVRRREPDGRTTAVEPVTLDAGKPAALIVDAESLAGAVALEVDVSGQAGARTLALPLELPLPEPQELPLPTEGLVKGDGSPHRVEVLPEGGGLIAGVPNALLVRVTDSLDRPLAGATVRLVPKAKGAPTLTGATGAAGLVELPAEAGATRQTFDVQITDGQGQTSSHDVSFVAGTLKTRLDPPGVVLPEGETGPAHLSVLSYQKDELVYCDLWRGGAMVWARTLALSGGRAPLEVPVPATGFYRLQCAYHPASPGGAYATALLLRTPGATTELLRRRVAEADSATAKAIAALPPDAALDPAARARVAAWLTSRVPFEPQTSVMALDTSVLDAEELRAQVAATRANLLLFIGAVFSVMVLWMMANVFLGYRTIRKDYEAFQESGDSPEDRVEAPSMSRARAAIQVGALCIIVILNVIAVVLLLRLVA